MFVFISISYDIINALHFLTAAKRKVPLNGNFHDAFWLLAIQWYMDVEWLRACNCGFDEFSCICIHVLDLLGAEANQVSYASGITS